LEAQQTNKDQGNDASKVKEDKDGSKVKDDKGNGQVQDKDNDAVMVKQEK
jgi:hypothetical protein